MEGSQPTLFKAEIIEHNEHCTTVYFFSTAEVEMPIHPFSCLLKYHNVSVIFKTIWKMNYAKCLELHLLKTLSNCVMKAGDI